MNIPAALFKAECLKLMDQVEKTRESIVITKHGKPVAQLSPVPQGPRSLFGYMKNTVKIKADLLAPLGVEWSAWSGDEDVLYARASKPARKK